MSKESYGRDMTRGEQQEMERLKRSSGTAKPMTRVAKRAGLMKQVAERSARNKSR
jgi:hypothetical protein